MKLYILSAVTSILILIVTAPLADAQQSKSSTIHFSGYDWEIRGTGDGGPGPNSWSPKNVWVDKSGHLHLKIAQTPGKSIHTKRPQGTWACAEISTIQRLGLGQYEFQVTGRLDMLDQNVVLGLFDYPTSDIGQDGTNELDIEFSRWGDPTGKNSSYTVFPAISGGTASYTQSFSLSKSDLSQNSATIHQFTRYADKVAFQSFVKNRTGAKRLIETWNFSPADPRLAPSALLPVHINLWLFEGKPPSNGKPVEIVIDKFSFHPNPTPLTPAVKPQ